MPRPKPRGFSPVVYAYIFTVATCGAVVVALSIPELWRQGPDYRYQWFLLVALTVISGLLPVTVNSLHITVSISETFVIAGTLLFGRAGGTVLELLDALFISLFLLWSGGLRWQQFVFNLGLPVLSVWLAAYIAGIEPLFRTELDAWFVLQLGFFTTLHFLINTWLLTFVIALQQGLRPTAIWWPHFREVLLNYAAGGSIAALLVYNSREVKLEFILAILPLLIVLFLTYQWSNQRIEAERSRNIELNRVFLSTIEALALAIDAKDQVTHGHIRRVQRYTIALATALGVRDQKDLDAIRAAALLHDTGKLAVPEHILNKPGPLTPSEFERMKVHADVGADIIRSIDFPYPVEPIVRHHHENWNGTGYPAGLKGQEIPVGARILSVVDCYDALTSDRPYRPRYSREHAEQVLRERRGVWYDAWVVDEFLKILDDLERADEEEAKQVAAGEPQSPASASQLEVITATTAEEREFNELRRELPLATSLASAADVLFRHLRRVIPAANVTLFLPVQETGELTVAASTGVGTSAIEGLQIPIGERVSGWAMAHKQAVVNSNAALELGPVARTFSTPLRYALAVPIVSGPQTAIGVITCYGSEPFSADHRRILEGAATLFAASLGTGTGRLSLPDTGQEVRNPIVH
jgi:putative nucleotidyltransferase with HDIG domain